MSLITTIKAPEQFILQVNGDYIGLCPPTGSGKRQRTGAAS